MLRINTRYSIQLPNDDFAEFYFSILVNIYKYEGYRLRGSETF